MLTTIEGIYKNGHIELQEPHGDLPHESRVIVTFLRGDTNIDLRERGIDAKQAAEMRDRLASFAEDWEGPEMDAYKDYDAAKSKL